MSIPISQFIPAPPSLPRKRTSKLLLTCVLRMVSEVSREASACRIALCETGRKELCLLTLSPACLPNADEPLFLFTE